MKNLLDWVKIGSGVVIGSFLTILPVYMVGKSDGRKEIEAEAAINALQRIKKLDENNAEFKNASDYNRCVIFMRDSRLPINECN